MPATLDELIAKYQQAPTESSEETPLSLDDLISERKGFVSDLQPRPNMLQAMAGERQAIEEQKREVAAEPLGVPYAYSQPELFADPSGFDIPPPKRSGQTQFLADINWMEHQANLPPELKKNAIDARTLQRQKERTGELVDEIQGRYDMEVYQAELEKQTGKFWTKTGKRWERGKLQLAGGLAHLAGDVSRAASGGKYGKSADDWARMFWDVQQKAPEYAALEETLVDRYFGSAVETAPFMLAAMAPAAMTGGATLPSALGSFLVSYGVEGNTAYQTALDRGASEREARIRGAVVGMINGGIEIAGGGGGKYFKNRAIAATLTKMQKAKQFGRHALTNALKEGLAEELPQELVQIVAGGDVPQKADGSVDYDAVAKRLADSAVMGTMLGGIMDPSITGAKLLANYRRKAGPATDVAQPQPGTMKDLAGEINQANYERMQYDLLLERASEGEQDAIDKLNAIQQQGAALPTYEDLLDRISQGDLSAAQEIQEGRYSRGAAKTQKAGPPPIGQTLRQEGVPGAEAARISPATAQERAGIAKKRTRIAQEPRTPPEPGQGRVTAKIAPPTPVKPTPIKLAPEQQEAIRRHNQAISEWIKGGKKGPSPTTVSQATTPQIPVESKSFNNWLQQQGVRNRAAIDEYLRTQDIDKAVGEYRDATSGLYGGDKQSRHATELIIEHAKSRPDWPLKATAKPAPTVTTPQGETVARPAPSPGDKAAKKVEPSDEGITSKAYKTVSDVLANKNITDDTLTFYPLRRIIREAYGIEIGMPDILTQENIDSALGNENETKKKLATALFRHLAEQEGVDAEGIIGPLSALTQQGKIKALEETALLAEQIHENVKKKIGGQSLIQKPAPSPGDKAAKKVLYHVTLTSRVKDIQQEGIIAGKQKATYKGQFGKKLVQPGTIYTFENYDDAVRWAAKMEYDVGENTSIVRINSTGVQLEQDVNAQIQMGRGKAYKSKAISADKIIDVIPLTPEMTQAVVQTLGEKEGLIYSPKPAPFPGDKTAGKVEVWQILNSRGNQVGKTTYSSREAARKALEKKITSSAGRTQFSVEQVKPAPAPEGKEITPDEKTVITNSESEQDLKNQADNPELPYNHNKGMVIIPPQVEEVLDSLTRVKDVAKGLPGAVRYAIYGAADYVEKQYKIPEGEQLARSIRSIARNADTREATQLRRINKDAGLKKLTKAQKILLVKEAQGRISRSKVPEKVMRISDAVRLIYDEDIDVANKAGIKRKVGGTYKTLTRTSRWMGQIPNQKGRHILYWARQKGLGHPQVAKAAEDMVGMGSAKDTQDALDKMIKHREMSHVNGALRGVDGNLESTRVLLPDYMVEFDPDIILPKILGTNAKMIAAAQEWGVLYEGQPPTSGVLFGSEQEIAAAEHQGPFNFDRVWPLLGAIKTKYGSGDAKSVENWISTTFGQSNAIPSGVEMALDYLSNGLTRLKLSGATISAIRNGFQGFGNTFMVSPSDSLRSFLHALEITKEGKRISEIVRQSGAMSHAKELGELLGGKDLPKGMIPFLGAEHWSQKTAGISGIVRFKTNVQRLAALRKGSTLDKILVHLKLLSVRPEAYLTDLLKNRTLVNPITDEQLNEFVRGRAPTLDEVQQFAYRLVTDTQFPMTLATRPIPYGNPVFRVATKFKYYAVNQTRLVWREAILQALKGTLAPLLQFLIRSALIGELWNLLRDLVRGGDNSITMQMITREEKRNAKDLTLAVGNDILDGTGIGIIGDLGYGIGTTIGGVVVGTGRNTASWLAESFAGHPATATRKLARREVVMLKDVSGLMNRADAWFINGNNKYFEYQRLRDRSFDFQDKNKKTPMGGKISQYLRKVLLGRPSYPSILPYEYAARQVTVGDISDAANYLAEHIKDNPEKKRSELRTSIERSRNQYAPFAGLADKDVDKFLAQFDLKTRRAARELQRKWLADYRKATNLAFERAEK